MLADYEIRTLELGNRLNDMTYQEWGRLKHMMTVSSGKSKPSQSSNSNSAR